MSITAYEVGQADVLQTLATDSAATVRVVTASVQIPKVCSSATMAHSGSVMNMVCIVMLFSTLR